MSFILYLACNFLHSSRTVVSTMWLPLYSYIFKTCRFEDSQQLEKPDMPAERPVTTCNLWSGHNLSSWKWNCVKCTQEQSLPLWTTEMAPHPPSCWFQCENLFSECSPSRDCRTRSSLGQKLVCMNWLSDKNQQFLFLHWPCYWTTLLKMHSLICTIRRYLKIHHALWKTLYAFL